MVSAWRDHQASSSRCARCGARLPSVVLIENLTEPGGVFSPISSLVLTWPRRRRGCVHVGVLGPGKLEGVVVAGTNLGLRCFGGGWLGVVV